jgi:hypothetical protein
MYTTFFKHALLILLLATVSLFSCERTEEKISTESNLLLTLSSDTVTFDTLFTSVGSITKRFRVYNTNDNAINLSNIQLGMGEASSYSLVVNGERGTSFHDEVILGNDSLLVLVEVVIDPMDENLPFLVKDSVILNYNTNTSLMKLIAWGQDAIFINNEEIPCGAIWTKDRPYVIYDSAWVAKDCDLKVEAGTKIYLDNGAYLSVLGKLTIEGTAEEKVLIRNTRLDPKYEIAPGQWNSIFFHPESVGNLIDHAEIKNGMNGIILSFNPSNSQGVELTISNTSIGHMSQSGLIAFSANLYAYNTEIFNCQTQLVGNFAGGTYKYEHCSFSNYPNMFSRDGPSVVFTNHLELSNGNINNDLNVAISNSIIWGSEEEELFFVASGNNDVTLNINNNIIRSKDNAWEELGNIISLENNFPGFYFPTNFDYQLDSLANARNIATASTVTEDLLGTMRDEFPDLGAYERKDSIQ